MKDVLYLVSYCLLGRNCRYDGGNAEDGSVIKFLRGKRYIPLCPEELGGLSTPRIPCEIKDGRVINMNGCDITEEFQLGAKKAFEKVKRFRKKQQHLKRIQMTSRSRGRYVLL